jgi:VanZ family protein
MSIVRAVKRWGPLVLWVAFIFLASSISDMPGGYNNFPEGTDKVVHFIEYFVLSLFLYRGIKDKTIGNRWLLLASIVVIGFVVACLDELYQYFVPGRDSSIMDLAADFAGIFSGALLVLYGRGRYPSEG